VTLSIRSTIGWFLVGLSVLCVIQSAREWRAWTPDRQLAEREVPLAMPIRFAGHRIDVVDDQPTDSISSEHAVEGRIQLYLDGHPLGRPSRALVRPGRRDLGRYHMWFQATRFHYIESGKDVLYFARRMQATPGSSVRFEVNTLDENGVVTRDVLHPWSLGGRYAVWRATQFLRAHEWEAFPLSMLEGVMVPIILLIFPIGTLILGIALVLLGRRRDHEPVLA